MADSIRQVLPAANRRAAGFPAPDACRPANGTASGGRLPIGGCLAFAVLLGLASPAAPRSPDSRHGGDGCQGEQPGQLMHDPSFESLPRGPLATTGPSAGWEVQSKGRRVIRDRLLVACVEDKSQARSGSKCLSLSIPKDTAGFEFVTVGQRLQLAAGKEYEASAWVRWVNGPDAAPAGAGAVSAHPSAIVSFWARHREGRGTFAGRDVWLFENRWQKLTFRFCATDPDQRTLVYVSLLPNQKPVDTTVLLDDFELTSVDARAEAEPRLGNLVDDPDFGAQRSGRIESPWNVSHLGGRNIVVGLRGTDGDRCVRVEMPEGTSNFQSAQLWQHLDLRRGVRYEISCRMRWDSYAADAPAPIVNYGVFHEDSGTWYGPIDQVLTKNAEWDTYRFVHVPPWGGRWKLYVQLNGWGNFGRAVTISVKDFRCVAAP